MRRRPWRADLGKMTALAESEAERCVSLARLISPRVGYRAKMNRRLQGRKINCIQCEYRMNLRCPEVFVGRNWIVWSLKGSSSRFPAAIPPQATNRGSSSPRSASRFPTVAETISPLVSTFYVKLGNWKVTGPAHALNFCSFCSRPCLCYASRPNLRTARLSPSRLEGLLDHPSHHALARAHRTALSPRPRPCFGPREYPVRVSADNRFILFVNGARVGDGPARGDLPHWRYERFNLAPFLHAGPNLITATVWNFGIYAPVSQMSDRTAFLLESEAAGDTSISTPRGWTVEVEPGHTALDRSTVTLKEYFASGPGEEIDASRCDWNWNSPSDSDSSWVPAASPMRDSIFEGTGKAHSADTTGDNFWGLIPDELLHMEFAPTSAGETVRTDNDNLKTFPASAVTVPAGSRVHILLDRKTLTTAYPQLTVSGGKGAHIRLTYSEALYDKNGHKGDRNDIDDRTALGLNDSFLPDGAPHRTFEPLWWRTWRYLDLDITTADAPLTLDSLKANFTAYPFQELAKFQSPDPDLAKIWETSWRTARLDAHETYMDTPYYEQLQYVGDTRIQALISYSVADDDRLALQALAAFDDSRIARRHSPAAAIPVPCRKPFPPSLCFTWACSTTTGCTVPIPNRCANLSPAFAMYLAGSAPYEQPDGLLRTLPWWSFIDWVSSGEITHLRFSRRILHHHPGIPRRAR